MNLDDIRNKHINVDELPDDIHMQLTTHKLANELLTTVTQLDKVSKMDDITEIRKQILQIRMHHIHTLATMLHLFDWIDFGDIIDKVSLRKYMEEYLILHDKLESQQQTIDLNGTLKIEQEENIQNG